MIYVMRSCECADCRKTVLNHVKRELPKELHEALVYAVDKYFGVVGHC